MGAHFNSNMLIGLILVVFAIAAKMMGSVDWGSLAKCGVVIGGLVVAIGIMSKMKVQPTINCVESGNSVEFQFNDTLFTAQT